MAVNKSLYSSVESFAGAKSFALSKVGEAEEQREVIPTGSLNLDIATGVGGWPIGSVIQVYGPESSGKTYLALHFIRESVKMGIPAFYLNSEANLNPSLITALGLSKEDFRVSSPLYLEGALKSIIGFTESIKQASAKLPEEERPKGISFVIDSAANFESKAASKKDLEDDTMGGEAKVWSKFFKGNRTTLQKNNVTLFIINQERDNLNNTPFAPKDIIPGGRSLKYNSDIMIKIKKKVSEKYDRSDAEDSELLYQTASLTFAKNKVGGQISKRTDIEFIPGRPFPRIHSAFKVAKRLGVIQHYDYIKGSFVKKSRVSILPITSEYFEKLCDKYGEKSIESDSNIIKVSENLHILRGSDMNTLCSNCLPYRQVIIPMIEELSRGMLHFISPLGFPDPKRANAQDIEEAGEIPEDLADLPFEYNYPNEMPEVETDELLSPLESVSRDLDKLRS